ncbi:HAMP domain-containing sensor histidine kinase [Amycolatopsis mongoliensis]|uniref:Sensor-like histidine kinase SenX3 n=1 Tax=Amycolatopsis mongoliensis TaxID=715475 RepID=A0A9Y2JIT4_9PSEU|nr:HAMP domain-containing sensor histidine kinase [Amycolatopsis sp. 4-36]WIX98076.1 HAMP domain-containing sensor histidine kinase [Amycolatopsis sp. 4-36]
MPADGRTVPGAPPVARVMVAVRLAVALSVVLLLVAGGDDARRHLPWVVVTLSFASGYAVVVAANPHWELYASPAAWLLTALDSAFSLLTIAMTGAATSPAVAILVLVVTAAAIRLPLGPTMALALGLGVAYLAVALLVDPGFTSWQERRLQGLWWTGYLVLTGLLGASLSRLVEREREAGIAARVEAMAGHAAAEEERDLRRRLLESYQSQQDGLAVLLHEFRTPVISLRALARGLAADGALAPADRETGSRLIAEHANHLSDMLDALGDVAASRRPAFGTGRSRPVELRALVLASADAAGLRPPRLRVHFDDTLTVTIDAQRFRRVLTNLLENAARHGEGKPVDVEAEVTAGRLLLRVLDGGSGVDAGNLAKLTGKFTAAGANRGTAGLGLWIVDQIVQALGGRVGFRNRPGGGLVAEVEIPVD